jgi:MFS family permease
MKSADVRRSIAWSSLLTGRARQEATAGIPDNGARDRAGLLAPTLIFMGALMAMVTSLGAPLLPSIARSEHVALSTAQWIITITLVSGALATPIMGRLADGPRQRAVILFALSVVSVGCSMSALAPGFVLLIVGRGLQGVGLGLLPAAMAMARRHLTPYHARQTIASLSIVVALGAGLGFPLTSLVAEISDFRGAYWLGAIMAAAALPVASQLLPRTSGPAPHRFDAVGVGLLGLVVVGVSAVLSEGGTWGWGSAWTIGVVLACAVALPIWVRHELTFADPLVDVRQVRNRAVLTADAAGFLVAVAVYLFLPVIVVFMQVPRSTGYGLGASVLTAGLVFVPYAAANFVASRCLTAYERRFGTRTMIPFSCLLLAAATGIFAFEHSQLWEAYLTSGVVGFAMGFSFGAMPGLIVRAVPADQTGSATGFYQTVRGIGLMVGSALDAALLMAHIHVGQALPDVEGFQVILLCAAGMGVTTAVIGYLLPGKSATRVPESEPAGRGWHRARPIESRHGADL